MKTDELRGVVHSDPQVMGGTPVFVGTRVPLENLIDYLEGGESVDDFLEAFPTVKREQVIAAMNDQQEESDSLATFRTKPKPQEKRKVKNGKPSNELVLSAYIEGNDSVFPRILGLYVKPGSVIADVTYGKGVFWRTIPDGEYQIRATDLQNGVDCRDLPYKNGELDCVVFDPPYMHTPGGSAHTVHNQFEDHYRNNGTGNRTNSKYHEAVLELYIDGGKEAHRVLRNRGVFIVKCQDEVCANRQRFTHVEIMAAYEKIGFVPEDLFVIVRNNRPGVSRVVQQVHARKNHSYFLVFWKSDSEKERWQPPQ